MRNSQRVPPFNTSLPGRTQLGDKANRGCLGWTTMCNVSHRISRVFLAWFPEEMRPMAAACPPLLQTARSGGRESLRQPSRRCLPLGKERPRPSLGSCPANPHTPHQPARARHHALPSTGGFREEQRSTAGGFHFIERGLCLR